MEKLDYRKTMLIGFGFFASSLAWSLYNANVPLLLRQFTENMTLIGFIMTIDNIFGIIFQPAFGALSDRTKTRFGRRMPYIMIGIPICAVAFFLIPRMTSLISMMAVLIIFNLVMSLWRSPVIALMPDLTPPRLRSQANGVINFMGGIGSLLAFGVGGFLINLGGYPLPFMSAGGVMVVSLICLMMFVKEPVVAQPKEEEPDRKKEQVHLSSSEKRSLLCILFAIFFWFVGYNAVETFFTTYAVNRLGVSEGSASMLLAFFSITFLAGAIPAGLLGGKIGRRRTIQIGLICVAVLFIPLYFVTDIGVLRIFLLLGGLSWSLININSLPMVVQMAGPKRVGTFTGYYYFFSFGAAIVSPPLVGFIFDKVRPEQYNVLFLYAVAAFAIAFLCMLPVRHGEYQPVEKH